MFDVAATEWVPAGDRKSPISAGDEVRLRLCDWLVAVRGEIARRRLALAWAPVR